MAKATNLKTYRGCEAALKAAGAVRVTGRGGHGTYWVHEATGVKVPLHHHGKDVGRAVSKGVADALARMGA